MQQTGRCQNCGSPIGIGQRFCGACGAIQSTGCSYCGNIVDPGSRFCQNCGTPVGGGGQPQQPQQQPGWGQPQQQPGWGQPQQQPGWGQPQQQPGWGQPQQQPGWGQPQQWGQPARPRQRSSAGPLVLLLVVLLIALGGFALWQFGPRFGIDIGKMLTGTTSSSSGSTVAPVISGIEAITDFKGATITWTTDQLSSSQVEYGITTSYGSVMPTSPDKDPSYKDPATGQYKYLGVTSHTVDIAELTANTTYHYRVKSKNKAGKEAVSADQTFQTQAVPAQ